MHQGRGEPDERTDVINVNVSTATRWGINAIILLAIVVALYIGKEIFIPTVIALLLAAMLWPLSTWMNQSGIPILHPRRKTGFPWITTQRGRWRLGWGLATITVITILVGVIVTVTLTFGLGFSKLFIDLGDDGKQRLLYVQIRAKLIQMGVETDEAYLPPEPGDSKVFATASQFVSLSNPNFQNLALGVGGYGLKMLWEAILVLFILLFLLLEGRMLSRRVVEIFGPQAAVQSKAVEALTEMAYQVRAYMVWRTIINFAMAALLGVIYSFLGLKLAWGWALLTAVFWYIPYLGPIAAGIPPIIDAFVSCDSPLVAVFILSFYVVWVVIEGYIVVPVVMGRSMEMNATTVMLACLFWERVWGATGLFLAMPLVAALKAICYHVPEWRPWANLMSSHDYPESPPSDPCPQRDGENLMGEPAPKESVASRD
jgi:AI-2 transport protein TqsA